MHRRVRLLLDDTVLPTGLTVEEEREACRALKGAMLRQEVYALDGTDRQEHPYTVTEQNFAIECVQLKDRNRHAVFFTHAREAIDYHYERDPQDPRITHAMTLEADDYGNVLKSAAIGYGRRQADSTLSPSDAEKQTRTLVTYTENGFTNAINSDDAYRTPLLCETRTYELTGYTFSGTVGRFQCSDFVQTNPDGLASIFDSEIQYEDTPTSGRQRRLIEHVRTLYQDNNLAGMLPFGEMQSLALPFESYKLAFTPDLAQEVYGGRITDAMIETEGRYVHSEGDADWWIPSGRAFYSPETTDDPPTEIAYARQHFFRPHRYRDPFHTDAVSTETFISYDAYDLLMQETRDALGNRTTIGERNLDPTQPLVQRGQDYRVLQPWLVMEPNRNRAMVAFDALGMVVGTAVMGKPEDNPRRGDLLDDFESDLTDVVVAAHLQDPLGNPQDILQRATTRLLYDLFAYHRTKEQAQPQPAVVYTLARETHDSDPVPAGGLRIQHSFSYSDGFGREIQKKIQAEPGPVPKRNPSTGQIITVNGRPEMTPNDVSPRWVGSGWTIFNNKSKPVRQFEPFFTDTHRFEADVRIGVSPVLFYDAVESCRRHTASQSHPRESSSLIAWKQATWDVNDTVLEPDPKQDPDVGDFFRRLPDADYLPTWHEARKNGHKGPDEQSAAE